MGGWQEVSTELLHPTAEDAMTALRAFDAGIQRREAIEWGRTFYTNLTIKFSKKTPEKRIGKKTLHKP